MYCNCGSFCVTVTICLTVYLSFKAGMKWQKVKQMMKEVKS